MISLDICGLTGSNVRLLMCFADNRVYSGVQNATHIWIGRMDLQATKWEADADHRYLFLRCYAIMTQNMLEGIGNGRFRNGPWVEGLLARFAEYYFEALTLYERQAADTPPVWQLTHDSSRQHKLHVLQHIMLGINAHINYDLVLTLHEILYPVWSSLTPADRQARRYDHETVNQVIADAIDQVQDEVVERHSPMMKLVDNLMGRMDEWLLAELIRGWRADVWRDTMGMLAAVDPEEKESIRREVEARALRIADRILQV